MSIRVIPPCHSVCLSHTCVRWPMCEIVWMRCGCWSWRCLSTASSLSSSICVCVCASCLWSSSYFHPCSIPFMSVASPSSHPSSPPLLTRTHFSIFPEHTVRPDNIAAHITSEFDHNRWFTLTTPAYLSFSLSLSVAFACLCLSLSSSLSSSSYAFFIGPFDVSFFLDFLLLSIDCATLQLCNTCFAFEKIIFDLIWLIFKFSFFHVWLF